MPKIIGGSLHEHREQTRQKLFAALSALMADQGFDAITLAEIASELYLSVHTVKSHQRMVYRKLGADGRRDAVRRAKELRLL